MKTLFLKPAQGLRVRNPDGGHLPDAGREVVVSTYWRRRLADGSVVRAKKPAKATTVKSNSEPAPSRKSKES